MMKKIRFYTIAVLVDIIAAYTISQSLFTYGYLIAEVT